MRFTLVAIVLMIGLSPLTSAENCEFDEKHNGAWNVVNDNEEFTGDTVHVSGSEFTANFAEGDQSYTCAEADGDGITFLLRSNDEEGCYNCVRFSQRLGTSIVQYTLQTAKASFERVCPRNEGKFRRGCLNKDKSKNVHIDITSYEPVF